MNVDNQLVFHLRAGHLPPKELVARILAKKPTAFGFGVQEADGADMQVMHEDGSGLDADTLSSFLEGRKARPTTMFFGNLKEGYDVEDIQPFTLTDPNGNTFMTLWCEGDIVGNTDDAAHTEQFNFVNGIIIPKIIDFCETFEGDIEKIMAKVNGDIFKKDVVGNFGHRGILHVLPFVGEPVLIGKNFEALGKQFDWGWCSQTLDFDKKVEAPKAETKKVGGWGYGSKKASAEPAPAPAPEPAPAPDAEPEKKDPPGVHRVGQTTVVDTKKTDKPIAIAVKPPAWLHTNQDIKNFYVIVSGKGHPGWKRRLPVEVTQNHEVLKCSNLDEYKKWLLANYKGKFESSTAPMTNNSAKPQTKAERLSASADQKTVPQADDLPIIPPKDLEKVLEFVAQHLDGNSKEIIDPKEMQAIEAKLPKFSDAVGLKGLEEMLNWPVSGLFGLAATDARAMVLWGLQWRAYARPFLLAEMAAKAKESGKATTKTTDLGNGSKKVESVAAPAPAAPAPAAKKGWGYGKKAA